MHTFAFAAMIAVIINFCKMPLNKQRRVIISHVIGEGMIVPRKWFSQQKLADLRLGRHAIDNLLKSNELYIISKGVYARSGTTPTWETVLYSLQKYFSLDVVAGGITALELMGYGHYANLKGVARIHLYSSMKLPKWIHEAPYDVEFIEHSNKELLGRGEKNISAFSLSQYSVSYSWRKDAPPLLISGPERALLEIISGIPKYISAEHAYQLMQGLTTLSPDKMQELLENCNSIKMRRLFFWLADHFNYTWLKKIDRSKINLGMGNRVIVKGGKFNKQYKITVPEQL
ncbi:MAG: type IV toxin-antitoxin system AbiEi family antitoxin domain-containing protein [Chitinophagaceae bacterium]|nr:type IV toxin-antitoxin system AbiEi family antitoxin domain-containing protein [Chitinophagaceae bacterium]